MKTKVPGPKKDGYGLETKTFKGESGASYVVHKTQKGSYHVFMEVNAKGAARDCGSTKRGPTNENWGARWKQAR